MEAKARRRELQSEVRTLRSGRTEAASLPAPDACRCTRFLDTFLERACAGLDLFLGLVTVTAIAPSSSAMSIVLELARPVSQRVQMFNEEHLGPT